MRAVGCAKTVFMIVRLVIETTSKQSSIVALLQFYRVGATLFGSAKHLFCGFQIALMVVADLRDHIAITVVADLFICNTKTSHHYCLFVTRHGNQHAEKCNWLRGDAGVWSVLESRSSRGSEISRLFQANLRQFRLTKCEERDLRGQRGRRKELQAHDRQHQS